MSIQPMDLQVLFSRLSQVGREQAAMKDMLIQSQAVTASEIAERSEEQDRRVSELAAEEEGPEKTGDEGSGAATAEKEEEGSQSDHDESDGTEVLRDPDLGQNIDISG